MLSYYIVKKDRYIIFLTVILNCIPFFVCVTPTKGANLQVPKARDLHVIFLKDSVTQIGNSFSFNRVSITNTSSVKQVFALELTGPENWQLLFENRKLFQIEPNETLELPIRVAASNTTLSHIAYLVTLTIKEGGINIKSTYSYVAKVRANSKWRASLINPDVKLDPSNKETYFQVILANRGNIAEEFSISFNTTLELTLPKQIKHVRLRANSDTVFQVGIISELRHLLRFKPQAIKIEVANKNNELQILTQKVFSNNTIFFENPSRWYNVPLFVELVSQNFNSKAEQLYYINSSGNFALSHNRAFSFNFRSNDYYAYNTGANRFANINYHAPKLDISLGDQTEFNNFLFDGLGGRVIYRTDNGYNLNLVGIRSRFGIANQFSLQQEIPVGKNKIENRTVFNFDIANRINSYLNIAEYQLIFSESNNLAIEGGLGMESADLPLSKINTKGQTAGLRYNYSSNLFIVRSTTNLSSKNFPGVERGVIRSSNEVRYLLKNYFAGVVGDYNSRSVGYIDTAKLIYLFGGRSSEYGLRSGYNRGRNYYTLTGTIVNQLQDSTTNIPLRSYKLNINTGLALAKFTDFSINVNIANNKLVDNSLIYSLNAYGTLKRKGLGFSFRVDKGPFYYSEVNSFMRDGTNVNRYQFAPFAEANFFKSQFNVRAELNYINDIASSYKNYIARLDLNLDLNKKGLSLRFYGNRDFNKNGYLNSLNFSLRKSFSLPLPGLQKYQSMKVVLFKDNNNNDKFDSSDELIPDANIRIKNQYLITNKAGEAFYKNVSKGTYSIDLGQVNNRGWVPKNGAKQTLSLSKTQDWYISFNESKYLSGRLNVEKDQFSSLQFNPSNIRITAINSKGELYSTLTDDEGAFFLNLPADTYVIKINTNVFNEDFRVLQETLQIDLSQNDKEAVVFEIRERKRKINIRKQEVAE